MGLSPRTLMEPGLFCSLKTETHTDRAYTQSSPVSDYTAAWCKFSWPVPSAGRTRGRAGPRSSRVFFFSPINICQVTSLQGWQELGEGRSLGEATPSPPLMKFTF